MNKQEIEEAIDYFKNARIDYSNVESGVIAERVCNMAISALTQQLNNGWIPVSERLPEEKESPITNDYYTYEVTYISRIGIDIRYYSFGGGHWWHGCACMDGYVTAWRERPEPYKEDKDAERN